MNSSSKNHYEVLGVSPRASDEEIKQAFHDFAKNNHPDRNPENTDSELFKEAALAYETLKDPLRRQAFDEAIAFDKKKMRTGRRQGRRLLMLFALLLFAPSALFLSLFISGDRTFLSDLGFLPEAIGTTTAGSEDTNTAAGENNQTSATASEASSAAVDGQANGEAGSNGEVQAQSAAPRSSLPDKIGPKAGQAANQSVPASPETFANLNTDAPAAGASVQSPIPDIKPAAVSPPPPEIIRSANVDVSGPFSDCNICPLMFIPRRFLPGMDSSNRAISMSVITVAQWEDCVNDGACPDLDQGTARKTDPVTGIDKEAADGYSAWLTKITGQVYATVMPESAPDCASQPNRVTSNNWDWMKSSSGGACAAPEGFRVLRQTEPAS
jgi:curved DNA-binding protein CbpA